MAERQPVAFGAWGGRRPDGSQPAVEGEPDSRVAVGLRDLISLLLLTVGGLAGMIGMGAWIGWPGVLIAFWLTAVPVAIVMGLGE